MLNTISKIFFVAFISLFVSFQAQASLKSDEDQRPCWSRLPLEAIFSICDSLDQRALSALQCVSTTDQHNVWGFFETLVSGQIRQLNQSMPIMPHWKSERDLDIIMKDPALIAQFQEQINNEMEKESFLFIPMESPLALHLEQFVSNKTFVSYLPKDLTTNDVLLNQLYQAAFNCTLSPNIMDADKRYALHHFDTVSPCPDLYFKRDSKQLGLENFVNHYARTLKQSRAQTPYVSFLNSSDSLKAIENSKCNVIITSSQLEDENTKENLDSFLKNNPDHTVFLSLQGLNFRFIDKEGCLYLIGQDLPSSLKSLRLVDPWGLVKSIGNSFLENCALTSLDISGLTNLTNIGRRFLYRSDQLQSFNMSGLKHLTTIEKCFLYDCLRLSSLNISGLSNLKEIQGCFASECVELISFNMSGLYNLEDIGNYFLSGCKKVRSVTISDLPNLREIGLSFLSGCKGLTCFTLSGLYNLGDIGTYFLSGCKNWTFEEKAEIRSFIRALHSKKTNDSVTVSYLMLRQRFLESGMTLEGEFSSN